MSRIPEFLRGPIVLGLEPWHWLGIAVALLSTYLGGIVATALLLRGAERLAARTQTTWDEALLEAVRSPLRAVAALLLFGAAVKRLGLPDALEASLLQADSALLTLAAGWLVIRLTGPLAELTERRFAAASDDPGRARGIHTVVVVLRRVVAACVGLVAVSLTLTQFELARNVGRAMLASAGVATLVAGLAAQKSLSNLFAGLQIALTQPIRVGDTVIVENEWGHIERISFSYVVVRVWDMRRLVLPINYFLEKPFQNWTLVSPEIMGTVELLADYRVPVAAVRAELQRFCEDHPKWDRKVVSLQVTAASERTMTLRALVSSRDAGDNWDLRCDVREALLAFLQRLEGGRYLPRTRFEGTGRGAWEESRPGAAPS